MALMKLALRRGRRWIPIAQNKVTKQGTLANEVKIRRRMGRRRLSRCRRKKEEEMEEDEE